MCSGGSGAGSSAGARLKRRTPTVAEWSAPSLVVALATAPWRRPFPGQVLPHTKKPAPFGTGLLG